jgi:hypothetical protein
MHARTHARNTHVGSAPVDDCADGGDRRVGGRIVCAPLAPPNTISHTKTIQYVILVAADLLCGREILAQSGDPVTPRAHTFTRSHTSNGEHAT